MNYSKIIDSVAKLVFISLVASILSTSCSYDDFVKNEYEYTAVYFPKERIDRTFIMGEGMRIGVGAVLGGRLKNDESVEITYTLDNSLVTEAGLSVLPSDYYKLVDENGDPVSNKITIPAGSVQGFVYVKADSSKFLSDPISLGNNYALGFRMENVTKADSILSDLKTTVITFSYINQLYGFYVQNGEFVRQDSTATETVSYPGGIDDVVELTMIAPDTLLVNGLATFRSAPHKMKIAVAQDNSISIDSIAGAIQVMDDGGSYYNPETKKIILNYSFDFNDASFKAKDTLDFRNRIVDGVNQFNYNL